MCNLTRLLCQDFHLPWWCFDDAHGNEHHLQWTTSVVGNFFISYHDDIIKWKHFPHYWPFVWGIHWSPVNSPHKGQWRGALMFSLICAWTNGWETNRDAGDLRHHHTHYGAIVMCCKIYVMTTQMVFKQCVQVKNCKNSKSSAVLALFVTGIYHSPINSTHIGPLWCHHELNKCTTQGFLSYTLC